MATYSKSREELWSMFQSYHQFRLSQAMPRIAGDAFLARPAPRRDVNELHLFVQRRRQHADFQIAVLRDIAFAAIRAVR